MNIKEVKELVYNDILLEIKHKFAFNSMLLMVFSTVFLVSFLIKDFSDQSVLNILIWIVLVFNSINTSNKSFIHITKEKAFYYNSLASPKSLILAKILYNSILMLIMSLMTIFCFELLLSVYKKNIIFFIPVFILGSICISSVLTFISAITYHTKNSIALTSVLSFPLLFPILILLVKLTDFDYSYGKTIVFWGLITALLLLQFIIIMLAYILFPYLWKD